tara:strand:+ start:713 stop:1264 length:552 start_codon:yes stop_codon:yes gene_type:complete
MNLSRDNSIYPLVIYKGWQCLVRPVLYPDGNPGLVLEDIDDGSPVATCTVNLPTQTPKKILNMFKGCFAVQPYEDFRTKYGSDTTGSSDIDSEFFVFIKDYSENEGMLDTLLKANIIEHFKYYVDDEEGCPIDALEYADGSFYANSGYIDEIPFVRVCHNELKEQFKKLYNVRVNETRVPVLT